VAGEVLEFGEEVKKFDLKLEELKTEVAKVKGDSAEPQSKKEGEEEKKDVDVSYL